MWSKGWLERLEGHGLVAVHKALSAVVEAPAGQRISADAAQICRGGDPASSLVDEAFPSPSAPCPDPARGRRDRAQKEPESATRRCARFVARKTIPIRLAAAAQASHGA